MATLAGYLRRFMDWVDSWVADPWGDDEKKDSR
jgi:hypothetical protein